MKTLSFSQTTYPHILSDSLVVITANQLKTTNLIFLEHAELEELNQKLNTQLLNYKNLYTRELTIDSLYDIAIEEYKNELDATSTTIKQQQSIIKKASKKLKWWRLSGCGVVLILLGAWLL